jgi:DNA-formamidopyrimidine glycosylase
MPEGHTIRHFATLHDHAFTNTIVSAISPQQRFADGAALLNERTMTSASAHGKHLFLHFDEMTLHIHLGLYGWFALRKNKGQAASDTVRLRLSNDLYMSDLKAPTACALIDSDQLAAIKKRLGPDPLHFDADPEPAWTKIHKSSKTIAALLMDQSVIAGIGNVYRAELLFRSKLNPFIPGKNVSREHFESIWVDSVNLLFDGAQDGRIRTVAQEHLYGEEVELHGSQQSSYVYKQTGNACRLCRSTIMQQELAGRQLYWCPVCQA